MEREQERVEYLVLGLHCAHCVAAVEEEVSAVPGVDAVMVDLETKRVEVVGAMVDDAAIRAAIEEAGYEAA
jgi:copper chaperone